MLNQHLNLNPKYSAGNPFIVRRLFSGLTYQDPFPPIQGIFIQNNIFFMTLSRSFVLPGRYLLMETEADTFTFPGSFIGLGDMLNLFKWI